jgi:hypothetical protein
MCHLTETAFPFSLTGSSVKTSQTLRALDGWGAAAMICMAAATTKTISVEFKKQCNVTAGRADVMF